MLASTDDESDPDVLHLRSIAPARYFHCVQNGLPRVTEKHVAFENHVEDQRKLMRKSRHLTSLAERSLNVFVKHTHVRHFEIQVVERCHKSLYPRILAAALLADRPRMFILRQGLKLAESATL